MIPFVIRLMTGLVGGALVWYAFSGGFLRLFIAGLWAVGVAYVGLTLAAYWEQTSGP